jgi:hypothetical protein
LKVLGFKLCPVKELTSALNVQPENVEGCKCKEREGIGGTEVLDFKF